MLLKDCISHVRSGLRGFLSSIRSTLSAIHSFFKPYIRVLIVLTKPTSREYKRTVKVTGFGIILIGLVGFLIFLITEGIKRLAGG